MQGKLFMCKFLGGNCPGRNFMGGILLSGGCLPWENYLRLIVQPVKVRKLIILEGNFMGVIFWGNCVTGEIIQG